MCRQLLLLSLASLLLGACTSGIEVTRYPVDAAQRLPALASYCWASGKTDGAMESLAPGAGRNKVFDTTVRDTVNKALAEKGYRPADNCSNAGFMIDYRMGTHTDVAAADRQMDTDSQESIHDYGFKWKIGAQQDLEYQGLSRPAEQLITVQHGTLHIAAFTAAGELLWHSSAEKVLSERETDAVRLANVRKATDRTMAHFPDLKP